LEGEFQKTNASLAIAIAALHLQRLGYSRIPDPYDSTAALPAEFINGLEVAKLGGRCDRRSDSVIDNLTWYIDGGHTLESIEVAGRWFASKISANRDQHMPARRVLIFNQQTRDAAALATRLHSTLAAALGDARPFADAIFCPNTTYKDAGYKADLVSMNTNKDDVDSLKVQRALAVTWDQLDPDAEVHVVSTIEEAVEKSREIASNDEASVEVLVTGSLHLVGGLIEVLESEVETGKKL
jgi:folylpolyglutamate synthase